MISADGPYISDLQSLCDSGGQEGGILKAWSSDSSRIAIADVFTSVVRIDSTGVQCQGIPRLGGGLYRSSIELSADADYVGLNGRGWNVSSTDVPDSSDWDVADWGRYDASILRFEYAGVFSPDSARGAVITSDGIDLVDLPTGETSVLVDFSDVAAAAAADLSGCRVQWTQAGVRAFCPGLRT